MEQIHFKCGLAQPVGHGNEVTGGIVTVGCVWSEGAEPWLCPLFDWCGLADGQKSCQFVSYPLRRMNRPFAILVRVQ